jgi:hypothetical protein
MQVTYLFAALAAAAILVSPLPAADLDADSASAVKSPVRWDPAAAEEVKAALHKMHDAWNSGDIASLKKLLVGDDVLITFELDPETHSPLRISSRKQLLEFVDGIIDDAEATSGTFVLEHPLLHCKATKELGICTEECFVTVKFPDGLHERYRLWSTAVAVKYPDGWKWIQWHMSSAGPVEVYKNDRLVWIGHKDQRPRKLVIPPELAPASHLPNSHAAPGNHKSEHAR